MCKIISLFILSMAAVTGQAQDYKCTINRLASSDDSDSKLVASRNKTFVGKEFTVERRTGLMAGVLKNSFITRPVVVDPGSSENSFKVVTTMNLEQGLGAGTNVFVLVVKEYSPERRKPFTFLENDVAYFGTCVHF
ncbi:hypothetical protein [Duganella sp. Root336D2]|uniref:hypothetical protein n=1 Tax=Duganella sp. Root336D2 TaxID=1736518 RepID=UPI0006FE35DC|nr:hypothetical protein [Duganella sp. Root336D2]KQV51512.1 hypothetical protein ASD07_29600 [Duganella sp. Root336D2]